MKVNPASVSILIIATSFGYPYTCPLVSSHHIGFGVVLNGGSYHGPHTFYKVSSPVVIGRSDPGLLSWPSHLL
jgi:hypothetical protein